MYTLNSTTGLNRSCLAWKPQAHNEMHLFLFISMEAEKVLNLCLQNLSYYEVGIFRYMPGCHCQRTLRLELRDTLIATVSTF